MNGADKAKVAAVCVAAFKGYPWFEEMPESVVYARWQALDVHSFTCLVCEIDDVLVGATWFALVTDSLLKKFPTQIETLTKSFSAKWPVIYYDATVTLPECQGIGVGKQLKTSSHSYILSRWGKCATLTRMRSDNHGIIAINKTKGAMIPTGITMETKVPNIYHEFWYSVPE